MTDAKSGKANRRSLGAFAEAHMALSKLNELLEGSIQPRIHPA